MRSFFTKITVLSLLPFIFGILLGVKIFPYWIKGNVLGEKTTVIQENGKQKKLVYQEFSPDGQKKIVLYEMPFTGNGELDYRNYLNNQYLFVVETPENGRESQIFINDYRTGYPHWLGNEYIFFVSGCGSSCEGLYLVNTKSKVSFQGVISTLPISQNSFKTTFSDWFGQAFSFAAGYKNIRSVYVDNKAYLIFEMWNNNKYLGEKKFLFKENSLEEQ